MAGDSDPTSPSLGPADEGAGPGSDGASAGASGGSGGSGDGVGSEPMETMPSPLDEQTVAFIVAEETAAERRRSSIEAGRRVGGTAGAAMAGAMLAIRDVLEGPQRDEIVAVAESPGEPGDIDTDGIAVSLDGMDFWAPPPPDAPDAPGARSD